LGLEDPDEHRLPRGRRPSAKPTSPALSRLEKLANTLLISAAVSPPQTARSVMSYDFEGARLTKGKMAARFVATKSTAHGKDLESIVVLLELAAVYLTTKPGKEFTIDQLIERAKDLGGGEVVIDDADAKIVLDKARFLKKLPGKKFVMK
jgi:hypothetical protein